MQREAHAGQPALLDVAEAVVQRSSLHDAPVTHRRRGRRAQARGGSRAPAWPCTRHAAAELRMRSRLVAHPAHPNAL